MRHYIAILLLVFLAPSYAHAQRLDRVEYLDRERGQKTTKTGAIQSEDPGRLVMLTGAGNTRFEIPAPDVVDVQYDGESAEMVAARSAERNKNFDNAATQYQAALRKANPNDKALRAHAQFKMAEMRFQLADAGGAAHKAAIDELRQFKNNYPDARQILPCLDLLSKLLVMDGQSTQEALQGVRQVRTKYANDRLIASRCDWFESQLLIGEGQSQLRDRPEEAKKHYAAALAKLQSMQAGADKTTALEIKVSMAECRAVLGQAAEAIKDMTDILKAAGEDSRLRAAALLGRGDCYRVSQQYREALWDYLWVDTIYNQDRDHQAKALFHLQEVFEKLGDTARAKECRERLQTDPRLKDTRFQKLAAR